MSTATLPGAEIPPRITADQSGQWISLAEASRILGVHPTSVQRAALAGSIKHRTVPGMRTRYSREDVERIAS